MKHTLIKWCLLALLVSLSVSADDEITLNGVFIDKAIFVVNGKALLLSLGEEKKGIKLLEVSDNSAVTQVGGKKRNFTLEKMSPRKVDGAASLKQNSEAKSHIIGVRMIHQTNNIATFEVEYFLEDDAEHATLVARTLFKGKITPYWAHSFARLKPGRNTTTVSISMTEDAPDTYMSDEARFDIKLLKGKDVDLTGTQMLELIKEWKK